MAPETEEEGSPAAGIGCAFVVMGLVGASVGLVAIFGWHNRVELEFFEIPLNHPRGRVLWTLGCLGLAVVGGWVAERNRSKR